MESAMGETMALWMDMCEALQIATEPKRFTEAAAKVDELVERSKSRGDADGEQIFRAQLYVLSDRLRSAEKGPQVGIIRHLDALSDDERLRILRRYCMYCGALITVSGGFEHACTCHREY